MRCQFLSLFLPPPSSFIIAHTISYPSLLFPSPSLSLSLSLSLSYTYILLVPPSSAHRLCLRSHARVETYISICTYISTYVSYTQITKAKGANLLGKVSIDLRVWEIYFRFIKLMTVPCSLPNGYVIYIRIYDLTNDKYYRNGTGSWQYVRHYITSGLAFFEWPNNCTHLHLCTLSW